MNAADVIRQLRLQQHPEGGWFAETWRDRSADGQRPAISAICYLLAAGDVSHWHRIDATEIWHHYAGAALELSTSIDGSSVGRYRLGSNLSAGERPQLVVPAHAWQSAATLGAWTLVGCTVAPAFSFDGFELAPPGWEPGR